MDAARLHKVWLRQQCRLREDLLSARRESPRPAVDRALGVYDAYYQARSRAASSDPVSALLAPGATSLERASYWIAGWRPTTFVHLLYSESGVRFEAQLPDLLLGVHSGDLGDLSPAQLAGVDNVQRRAIEEEEEVGGEMERVQEEACCPFPPSDADLEEKAARVGTIMGRADEVRMRTLKGLVAVLGPVQAVDLLVAMADLEIGVREIGVEYERSGSGGRRGRA